MASTKPDGISDRERALGAMKDRRDGKTWAEVADAWGYQDKSTACRAVRRVLERVEGETADDYREVIAARYEALWAKSWEAINTAESKGQLVGKSQLVASARGVLDSLAKLQGLQASTKSEVTVVTRTAIDSEIEALFGKAGISSGEETTNPQENS
ncbi:AraC family transcriptional regulator [Listeria monocytogenes]|nr:AraC family transcriptional regulator [Listeria monocytogenes]EGR8637342.1 AraC family transcriptional regulator [Listeria monocytogenes]EGR8666875.1 AraC family transcriptional regulator [Listeria monocytogenes]EGS3165137.1 AraC family transcriptional regulator [Listeria monocytogenes]EGS4806829.1 AraC family transcriptional regulator [Listeria monocytogenes]